MTQRLKQKLTGMKGFDGLEYSDIHLNPLHFCQFFLCVLRVSAVKFLAHFV